MRLVTYCGTQAAGGGTCVHRIELQRGGRSIDRQPLLLHTQPVTHWGDLHPDSADTALAILADVLPAIREAHAIHLYFLVDEVSLWRPQEFRIDQESVYDWYLSAVVCLAKGRRPSRRVRL